MQPLDQLNEYAADLYWLAFLLTGHCGISIDATVEALDLRAAGNPFFSAWMHGWSRKVVVAKALGAIREELAASASRVDMKRCLRHRSPRQEWALSPETTKIQLERALLAIDVFPRCAVLLSVFEKLSMDDTSILLNSDRDRVSAARSCGLQELAGNLAEMQGQAPDEDLAAGLLGEIQHA
jgi:DNA-directed RNA polymerase specialized sigma24 family protein